MKKYLKLLIAVLFLGVIIQSVSIVHAKTEDSKGVPKLFYMKKYTETAQVDNRTLKISETYDQNVIPYIENEILFVPAEKVAKFMNGTYSYNKKSKEATFKLAGSTFVVKAKSKEAKVNGSKVTMKDKAVMKNGILMIPASVFVDNLKTHNAIVHDEKVLIISKKGAEDFYTDDKEPIGYCVPDTTTWQERLKKQVNGDKAKKEAQAILNKIITPNMTDIEKVIAVNDYLIENTTYTNGDFSLYGPILTGTGVCQGYSFSAELLLNMAGVNCTRVQGYAGLSTEGVTNDILDALGYMGNLHEWNLVEIDGYWYHLDVTFNDGTVNGAESFYNSYQYFLLSDEEMAEDHIWRRTFYHEAPKSFASTTIAKDLDSKGYPVINGRVSLPSGSVAPKGGVDINIKIGMGSDFYMHRTYWIEEGKSYVDFTIVVSKTLDKQRFQSGFRIATEARGYESEISVSDTSSINIEARLVSKEINLIQGKLILPASVTLTKDYKYTVELVAFYKVEGANGMRTGEDKSYYGVIKAGDKEVTFDFDYDIPTTEYKYVIRYYITGFNKTPLVESGYLTADGTIASERTYISGNERPLSDFEIKVEALEVTATPTPTPSPVPSGIKMTKENRNNLINELKKLNIANDAKLSKLMTQKQIVAFEKKEPTEVSTSMNSEHTLYYWRSLDNGIKVNSFYMFYENNTKLSIQTSISNMELTAKNYITTMNQINKYVQTATSSKKTADFYVASYDKSGLVDFDSKNKEQIFKDIMAHKIFLIAIYEVGNNRYQISLTGEKDTLPRVTISTNHLVN